MSVMVLVRDNKGTLLWKRTYITWQERMQGIMYREGKPYDLYGEPLTEDAAETILFKEGVDA